MIGRSAEEETRGVEPEVHGEGAGQRGREPRRRKESYHYHFSVSAVLSPERFRVLFLLDSEADRCSTIILFFQVG